MKIEEQAAMYEAGVREQLEAVSMGKGHLSRVLAEGTRDHMALEDLFSEDEDEEKNLRVLLARHGTLFSFAEIGPKVTLQGYAAADAVWSMNLFERWNEAKRLAAQRPLIHNGKKPRK